MRCAVLHIGTEKTGSTSIQAFLSTHRSKLYERGILFPQSCGLSCHSRLVAYTKENPDARLLQMIAVANERQTLRRWKRRFQQKHHKEVVRFHARNRGSSTAIYSSEHFQSLVRESADIKRIHRLLCDYYDKVTLVVYLKRQDKMAFSAHNTAVQSGLDKRFSFDELSTGYYYDHLKLVSNWASVFGQECVKVRVCEKPRLRHQSVVSDLLHIAGLSELVSDLPPASVINERLSPIAIELLLKFNHQYRAHSDVGGVPMLVFRKNLIKHLTSLYRKPGGDSGGDRVIGGPKPTQDAAQRFCAQFEASNTELFDRFLGGAGFDQSFAEYPVTAAAQTAEVSDELLSSVINQVLLNQGVG